MKPQNKWNLFFGMAIVAALSWGGFELVHHLKQPGPNPIQEAVAGHPVVEQDAPAAKEVQQEAPKQAALEKSRGQAGERDLADGLYA